MSLEALDAVASEDKPDLERAEAAAEAEVPISVVDDEPCVRPLMPLVTENLQATTRTSIVLLCPQILRRHVQFID